MADLPSIDKAAIVLSLLNPSTAAKVLSYLPADLSEFLSSNMRRIRTLPPELLSSVVEEFNRLSLPPSSEEFSFEGESVRKTPSPGISRQSSVSRRLAQILSNERQQLAVFILSQVFPELNSEIASLFTADRRVDLEKRMRSIHSNTFFPLLATSIREYFNKLEVE